jgi:hypothetical protein
MHEDDEDEDDYLSEEDKDKLSIENEIMKIKLQMQFGDDFIMRSNGTLPPEIENQFLKQIMAFEANHGNGEEITVFERIGKPDFKKAEELKPEEISAELDRLNDLMESNGIMLNVCDGPYDDIVIYKFITEELFLENVEKEFVENTICNFIYEEFHLNDKAEITKNTHEFMKQWFAREFTEQSYELADPMVTADGKILPIKELFKKMSLFFDAFEDFKNDEYTIEDISFDLLEDGNGMGFSEGMVKYDAMLDNGEAVHFEGGYKLYMQRGDDWWDIFYFVMPGFMW